MISDFKQFKSGKMAWIIKKKTNMADDNLGEAL